MGALVEVEVGVQSCKVSNECRRTDAADKNFGLAKGLTDWTAFVLCIRYPRQYSIY
jgi:hypothetical protein